LSSVGTARVAPQCEAKHISATATNSPPSDLKTRKGKGLSSSPSYRRPAAGHASIPAST
jgi:hypothetical protein